MSRILKVSQSNYRIQTGYNGTITLDTGPDVGTTYITGDLVVQGNTTSVNTSQLYIEDRLITLNKSGGNTNSAAVYPDWVLLQTHSLTNVQELKLIVVLILMEMHNLYLMKKYHIMTVLLLQKHTVHLF